jgi:hypothetical protein
MAQMGCFANDDDDTCQKNKLCSKFDSIFTEHICKSSGFLAYQLKSMIMIY